MKRYLTIISLIIMFSSIFLITINHVESMAPFTNTRSGNRISHTPIKIVDDENLTSENGVISGDGTEFNPFIITNWTIDATGTRGIEIVDTDSYCIIKDCIIFGANEGINFDFGIRLDNANNITIRKCIMRTLTTAIFIGYSKNCKIIMNDIQNVNSGISSIFSKGLIEKNTIINSTRPLNWDILSSGSIINNTIINSQLPVTFAQTDENTSFINNSMMNSSFRLYYPYEIETYKIEDNTVNNKPMYFFLNEKNLTIPQDGGEYIFYQCQDITIKDLKFDNVSQSIQISYSENMEVRGCNFKDINWNGIYSYSSKNISIIGNSFLNNYVGLSVDINEIMKIKYNIFNTCLTGISAAMKASIICYNEINNCETGTSLKSSTGYVFNNNFINCKLEATDGDYECNWNISEVGNYWSKYTGLDDGSNMRIAGDGIGDTNIPYLGLDYYPLINPVQIIFPEIPLIHDIPSIIRTIGYNFTWQTNNPMDRYVLQIDDSMSFDQPIRTFEGDRTIFNTSLEEGIYYLRIKSIIDDLESGWSDTIGFIVDDPPEIPTGLEIISITNNSLNLTWEPHQDIFPFEYTVEISDNYYGPYSVIDLINQPYLYANASGLQENTQYFFRMKIVDIYGLESPYTDIINITTIYGPHAPMLNTSNYIIEIFEDTPSDHAFNLNSIFHDVNRDQLIFNVLGTFRNITVEIHDNGSVSISSAIDWSGEERFTFGANDSIFNTKWNVLIRVLEVNDPPSDPTIILLEEKYIVGKDQWVEGNASDPDIRYGDELIFRWSMETGIIGEGRKINLSLPLGTYNITLNITDSQGISKEVSMEIEIFPQDDKPENGTNGSEKEFFIIITIIIGIVILPIIGLLIYLRIIKKPSNKRSPFDEEGDKIDHIDTMMESFPKEVPPEVEETMEISYDNESRGEEEEE